MAKKKVLVTGAPGWLGTRFVEILNKKHRRVKCLVLKGVNDNYLRELNVEVVKGDVTNPRSLRNITNNVETVFHIAGMIHPRLFGVSDFFRVNTQGTKNILDAAIKSGVKRFVYVSSNSPGGCYKEKVIMNEYTPEEPYMNYGKSKFLAERIVNDAYLQGKIETVIIRPCWFYGIRQPERQTRLIKMVKDGKALVFGDGKNLRSMTYIDNLCDALLLAEKRKNAKGETYWIADDRPYTTLEIYETIADLLGVKLRIRKIPGFFSDFAGFVDGILQKFHVYQKEIHVAGEMNKNIACSIKKAKKDLGYKPKIGLREGMRRSIEWVKEQDLL